MFDLLKSYIDIFVHGFKTYYDDVKGFLNHKVEMLSRDL